MRLRTKITALAFLALLAQPALAQSTAETPEDVEAPDFDAGLVDACLSSQTGLAREVCIGMAANSCMASELGGSGIGMGYCLWKELEIWDAKLNEVYPQLIARAEASDAEAEGQGWSAPQ
ncbi:MAG: lysozyme inhibitor LprI family protein, partial [Paracoccus sp. (in: a-proteobacteria)]